MPTVDPIIVPIVLEMDPHSQQVVAEEQERLRGIYNKTAGKKTPAATFAQVEARLNAAYGGDPAGYGALRGQYTSLARGIDRYSNILAPIQGPTQKDVDRQVLQAKRDQIELDRQLNQMRRQALSDQRASLSAQRDARAQQQRSLTALGVFTGGSSGPIGALGRGLIGISLASQYARAQSNTQTPGTAVGAATSTGALAGAAGAAAQGILNTVAAGTGAPPGGSAGAATSAFGSLTSGPNPAELALGDVGIVLVAIQSLINVGKNVVGLADKANQVLTDMRTQQYGLLSNVAGAGTPQHLYAQTIGTGHQYFVNPDTAIQIASQLGEQGVHGTAFGGDVANTMALMRLAPDISQQQAVQTVSTLATHGQMGDQQIGALFDTFNRGAQDTGVSLSKLIDNLTTFNQTTGGVALTLRGYTQLVAAQGITGQNINAFGVASNMVNATGSGALALAGMLGISPDLLYKEQTNAPGALMDRQARFLQQATHGTTGQNRIDIAEAINQQLVSAGGGFNLQGLSNTDQNKLMNILLNQGGTPFEQAYERLTKQIGTPNAAGFQAAGRTAAGDQTTKLQQVVNDKMVDLLTSIDQHLADIVTGTHGAYTPTPQPGVGPPGTPSNPNPAGEQPGTPYFNPSTVPGKQAGFTITTPTFGGQRRAGKITGALAQTFMTSGEWLSGKSGMDKQNAIRLLATLAAWESNLDPTQTSPSGAMGIAQFMPSTIAGFEGQKGSPIYGLRTVANKNTRYQGKGTFNPYDPTQEIPLEAYYLNQLLGQTGNVQTAVELYNAGSAANITQQSQIEGANVAQGMYKTNITVIVEDKTAGGVKMTARQATQQAMNPATNTNPGRPLPGRAPHAPPPHNPKKRG